MPKGIYQRKKGIKLSEESKRNWFKKGEMPWNKGKHIWLDKPHPKGMLGKQSSRKGTKVSEELRKKLSIAHMGKKQSQETIAKRVLANVGKKRSIEFRQNLSLRTKGNKYALGYKRSESEIEIIKQRRLKQIFPFKDTSIEIKLQNWLKEQNIEFKTHYPILGQPDIFIKPNICIFADGCYWHKCPTCGFGEGKERDEMVTIELQKQGYMVIRLWEHEINKDQFNGLNQLLN